MKIRDNTQHDRRGLSVRHYQSRTNIADPDGRVLSMIVKLEAEPPRPAGASGIVKRVITNAT